MSKNNNINIHNYEEHIVNYLDGKLSPVEAAELFLFLEIHPELGEDLDELRQMRIEPDLHVVYDFKEALKSDHDVDALQISSDNYLYYLTAYTEGDLSRKGMDAVNYFIAQSSDYKNELLLLEKCKIEPTQDILYINKSELKKKTGILIPMPVRWAALAASLLILFTVYIRFEPAFEPANKTFTQTETPVEKKFPDTTENAETIPAKEILVSDEQAIRKTDDTRHFANADTKQFQPEQSDKEGRTPAITTMPVLANTTEYALVIDASLRQTYSMLFDDISLSQQIMLAYAENHPEKDSGNENRAGINVGQRFNQYLQTGTQVANQVSESFSGWMLADLGVRGINILTDNELKLVREVQQDGTTGDVMLKSDDESYLLKKANQ